MIKTHENELARYGIEPGNLGTHSTRKGVATYVSSGCTVRIVFQFAKSKSLQDGEEHVGPWHVYSNPLHPDICPFLSMAKFLFTYPEI